MATIRMSSRLKTGARLRTLRLRDKADKDVAAKIRQLIDILNTPGGRIVTMLSMIMAGLLTKTETVTNSACFALLLFLGRTARRHGQEGVGHLLMALLKKKASG